MTTFETLAQNFSAPKTNYVLPAKTRDEAIEWLLGEKEDRSRHYYGTTHFFCWNVKVYTPDEPKGDPKYDTRWEEWWAQHGNEAYCDILEDARDNWTDHWSSYPGDDDGDWKFGYAGRSGGWLVLEQWRGYKLDNRNIDDFEDWLNELYDDSLFKFMVGIVCANADFTQAKAKGQVEYFIQELREQNEAEWKEEAKEEEEHREKRAVQVKILKGLIFDMRAADREVWPETDINPIADLIDELEKETS